jgi:hypothetical protein
MRRVLTLIMTLLAISVITPAIAHACATRTAVAGNITLSVTSIGDISITRSGIMHQVGAAASGPVSGAISGQMQIVLNANFNLNTGEGVAFGTFVISNTQGMFEGMFRVQDTGFIYFEGSGEGQGTAAYEGMKIQLLFQGTDLYRIGYTGPDGLTMTYDGSILSPKGI